MPTPRVALTSFTVAFATMFVATSAFDMRTSQLTATLLYALLLTALHLTARLVFGRRADLPAAAFAVTVAAHLLAVRVMPAHDPLHQDGAAVGLGVVAAVVAAGWQAMRASKVEQADDRSASPST